LTARERREAAERAFVADLDRRGLIHSCGECSCIVDGQIQDVLVSFRVALDAYEAGGPEAAMKFALRTRPDYDFRCQRCGAPHNLDTSIPSEFWNVIVERDSSGGDKYGALCTLCIDDLLVEKGLACEAEFYFVGKALTSRPYVALREREEAPKIEERCQECHHVHEHPKRCNYNMRSHGEHRCMCSKGGLEEPGPVGGPPPRYDDVYFEGVAWLDAMARGESDGETEALRGVSGDGGVHRGDGEPTEAGRAGRMESGGALAAGPARPLQGGTDQETRLGEPKPASQPDNLSFAELRAANVPRCVNDFRHTLDSWSVAEWTNAMCGEAGEAANIAKKMIRHRGNVAGNKGEDRNLPALREKLGRELADVVIYADLTAASQGIELAAAVRVTFDAKSEEIGSSIRLERRTKGEETSDLDDPERVARAVRSVFGNATLEEVRLLVEALR
jgi:hypothetical protein